MKAPRCRECGAFIHVEYDPEGEHTVADLCDNACAFCKGHVCECLECPQCNLTPANCEC